MAKKVNLKLHEKKNGLGFSMITSVFFSSPNTSNIRCVDLTHIQTIGDTSCVSYDSIQYRQDLLSVCIRSHKLGSQLATLTLQMPITSLDCTHALINQLLIRGCCDNPPHKV